MPDADCLSRHVSVNLHHKGGSSAALWVLTRRLTLILVHFIICRRARLGVKNKPLDKPLVVYVYRFLGIDMTSITMLRA